MKALTTTLSALLITTLPALTLAAGDHGAHGPAAAGASAAAGHDMADMHKDTHESAIGVAGDPSKVTRTIPVDMHDTMRFTPDKVSVKAGETVRFFIINKGKVPHEMVLGTTKEIEEHAEMMRKMPGMVHKEPNQITLAPGQRGGIVWQFTNAGTFTFACLEPGHKEAGMVGTVVVN